MLDVTYYIKRCLPYHTHVYIDSTVSIFDLGYNGSNDLCQEQMRQMLAYWHHLLASVLGTKPEEKETVTPPCFLPLSIFLTVALLELRRRDPVVDLPSMSSVSSQSASSAVQFCDDDDDLLCRFLRESEAARAEVKESASSSSSFSVALDLFERK